VIRLLVAVRRHLRQQFIGYIALFFALGLGSAWAAVELGKGDVKSRHIGKGQVKNSDLADDAVTSEKVANGSLLLEDFAAAQLPGVAGPQGPPGATSVVVRVSAPPLTLGPSESGVVSADCASGEVATGGGVKFLNAEKNDLASASYPRTATGVAGEGETPTGWGGRVFNGTQEPKEAAAYVVCAQP
jgi:hypothetical protein